MQERFTIIVLSENSPGVLQRVTSVFTRRRINIESLTVSETEHHERSRFTVTFLSTDAAAAKLIKQIQRFVEVLDATLNKDVDLIYRELAFFRMSFENEKERDLLWELARSHHGQIASLDRTFLVIEKSGTEDEINSFKKQLPQDRIQSFIRSGRIAIEKKLSIKTIEKTEFTDLENNKQTIEGDDTWQHYALEA
jgi:acetolactate synthase-1/3 small subunit